jgi:FkbM family methyltransferase
LFMLITLANKFRKELKRVMEADPDFFFIQIGANDGKTADPLRSFILKYNWKGILVEPIKYYFEKLQKNYSTQNRLTFENSSIGSIEGFCDMYRYPLRSNLISHSFGGGGLSSFLKKIPLSRSWRIPGAKNHLIKEKVNCITFRKLLDKYKVNKINLLVIDAEGYDFEILKQIDFHFIRPAIIHYEHNNLSPDEKKESIEFVTRHGYRVSKDFRDILAY